MRKLGTRTGQSGDPGGREQSGLKKARTRNGWIVRTAPAAAALTLLAHAGPAHASGGLHLWPPDWTALGLILVAFILLISPLNALIFKPLFRAIDEREDRIAGARRRGEKLEKDAEQVLERYQREVREAREAAEQDRRSQIERARSEHQTLTEAARGEADAEVGRSRAEIRRSFEEARSALRTSAQPLAHEAAARILGRSLS
jgi:F-type H+-transporting ATPase subunit b